MALLSEVSVLDLSIWRPGPYATSLLTYLGADVLKVEPPGGDPMRFYPELFESVNAGKRSIVLDLKDDDDRARALALATSADVVVEGFRPGVMARLGLDEAAVRAVNPAVVYCSISGYGQQGDLARLPGHDVNYQAWSGALSPDGQRASMPPLPIADLASGLAAAFGICAALLGRGAGGAGTGTYVDVSMTDVLATWTGAATATTAGAATGAVTGAAASVDSDANPATRSGGSSVPGYGLYATADGHQVALGVVNEPHFWSALCAELGLEPLRHLAFDERSRRGRELDEAVAQAVAARTRDELVTALTLAGVPVAPVLDRRAVVANGPFPSFPAFPIRLGADAGGGAGEAAPTAPKLDEHHGQGFR